MNSYRVKHMHEDSLEGSLQIRDIQADCMLLDRTGALVFEVDGRISEAFSKEIWCSVVRLP